MLENVSPFSESTNSQEHQNYLPQSTLLEKSGTTRPEKCYLIKIPFHDFPFVFIGEEGDQKRAGAEMMWIRNCEHL